MTEFVFITLNLIALAVYVQVKKRLHPLEAAGCYMVSLLYNHEWLIILSINAGLFETSRRTDYGLILTLNGFLLLPILSNLFLEQFQIARSAGWKAAVFGLWTAMMMSLEYMMKQFGLINHLKMTSIGMFFIWTLLGLLLILCKSVFHHLICKMEAER